MAYARLRENLEVGRAPFLDILEVRKCPEIAGVWKGTFFVKDVKGGNIKVGKSRPAVLELKQEGCDLIMTFGGNQIAGFMQKGETLESGPDKRAELDEATLNENPTGPLTRAELKLWGLGSGKNQGFLDVTIEQQSGASWVQSGGRFSRK
jgi:hypothetical protein